MNEKPGENAIPQVAALLPVNTERRWLRYPEVAERTGVCERTVRRDMNAGNLPKPIKVRGCVCFDWLEVEAALKARKQK
jgi:predicted DNA-binding transcriptional regulator AlpA